MAEQQGPTWTRFFFGAEGLRGGFRAVAFFAILIPWTAFAGFVGAIFYLGLISLGLRLPAGERFLVVSAITYLPAFVLTALLGLLDRGGLRSVGMGGPVLRSAAEWTAGAAFGGLLVLLALALPAAVGDVSIAANAPSSAWARLPVWFVGLAIAAAWEEIVFRGYGFQWLCRTTGHLVARAVGRVAPLEPDRVGQWIARGFWVTASSVVFAVLHLANPNAGAIGTANTVLAGIWLAVAVFRTRALWTAFGMHFGWNAVQGPVLGLPISGLGSAESGIAIPSLLSTTLTGPRWATGGGYGIESAWAATAVLLLAIGLTALWPRRPPDEAARVLRIGSPPR